MSSSKWASLITATRGVFIQNSTLLFLFSISLFLSACSEVNSQFPLSQPGEQPSDQRLPGVWTLQEKNNRPVFLHISEEKEGWLEGIMVGPQDGPGPQLVTFQALTTQIGGDNFLNIRSYREFKKSVTDPPEKSIPKDGLYWILLYEVSGDGTFYFRMMDYEYVRESIKAGRVDGNIAKDEPSITLTGNPEKLIQFIKKSDTNKLFPKSLQLPNEKTFFKKLNPSTSPMPAP